MHVHCTICNMYEVPQCFRYTPCFDITLLWCFQMRKTAATEFIIHNSTFFIHRLEMRSTTRKKHIAKDNKDGLLEDPDDDDELEETSTRANFISKFNYQAYSLFCSETILKWIVDNNLSF